MKTSGTAFSSANVIAQIGAPVSAVVQSDAADGSGDGTATARSRTPDGGTTSSAFDRQRWPYRSCPEVVTVADVGCGFPAADRSTRTPNASSIRLSGGASMWTRSVATSAGGGACATTVGCAADRWSTAADRFSNHGGNTAEIAPATPRTVNGMTQ